jgi:hypothetical protein
MALKDSTSGVVNVNTKLRLNIVFEGVEGQSETDYMVFNPSTDVGTAMAIVRSHFMQKYYSTALPLRGKTPRGDTPSRSKEYLCDCVALWSYDGEESDELSFKDGDVIGVIAKPHKVLSEEYFLLSTLSPLN